MHFVKFCLLYTKNTLENIFLNFWIMVIQQLYSVQYIQSLQCEFYKSKYEYRKFRETFRIVLFFI